MTTQSNHSPLPFKLPLRICGTQGSDGRIEIWDIKDANDEEIIKCDCGVYPPDEFQAAYIIEAVNSHSRLVQEHDEAVRLLKATNDELGSLIRSEFETTHRPMPEMQNRPYMEALRFLRGLSKDQQRRKGEGK